MTQYEMIENMTKHDKTCQNIIKSMTQHECTHREDGLHELGLGGLHDAGGDHGVAVAEGGLGQAGQAADQSEVRTEVT